MNNPEKVLEKDWHVDGESTKTNIRNGFLNLPEDKDKTVYVAFFLPPYGYRSIGFDFNEGAISSLEINYLISKLQYEELTLFYISSENNLGIIDSIKEIRKFNNPISVIYSFYYSDISAGSLVPDLIEYFKKNPDDCLLQAIESIRKRNMSFDSTNYGPQIIFIEGAGKAEYCFNNNVNYVSGGNLNYWIGKNMEGWADFVSKTPQLFKPFHSLFPFLFNSEESIEQERKIENNQSLISLNY